MSTEQQNTIALLKEALLSITNRKKPLTETEKDQVVKILSQILQTFNK